MRDSRDTLGYSPVFRNLGYDCPSFNSQENRLAHHLGLIMLTILLLLVALARAFGQLRSCWREPRKRYEALLQNLLGFSIGAGGLLDAYFALVSTGFHPLQNLQSFDRLSVASLFFGLGIAGCFCFYRKIFWFGTSIVATAGLVPIGVISLFAAPAAENLLRLNLMTKIVIGQIAIPLVIAYLMVSYYLKYVRAAR